MKRNKSKKKSLITIIIIIGILFVGNISIRYNIFSKNVVEAITIVDTLEIIKDNNPINIALNERLRLIEEEKAKNEVDKRIKEIKAQRAEAERIAEVNRLIALNEAKATEVRRQEIIKDNMKIAYLTFDDGPSMLVTPDILEILNEYNIKATFFIMGRMADKYPEMLKKVYNAGHSIGNHSYSHNYGYIYKNPKNFMMDIDKANETLKNILGEEFSTNLIRFPGGSFGKKAGFIKAVENSNYKYFDWNALNGDAEGINLGKDRLINRLKDTAKNKKHLIILMHDTDAKSTTVEALREIIDYLIEEGYYFDVLDNYNN